MIYEFYDNHFNMFRGNTGWIYSNNYPHMYHAWRVMHTKLVQNWILYIQLSCNSLWHICYIWKHQKCWWKMKWGYSWTMSAGRMWLWEMWLWQFLNFSVFCSPAGLEMSHFSLRWEPRLFYSYLEPPNHLYQTSLVFDTIESSIVGNVLGISI